MTLDERRAANQRSAAIPPKGHPQQPANTDADDTVREAVPLTDDGDPPLRLRTRGAWGANPGGDDADAVDDLGLDTPEAAPDELAGADEPLLFLSEDERAGDDARAARAEEAALAARDMGATYTAYTTGAADEFVPPTNAGSIPAVANARTVGEAADLDPTGGAATDAEIAETMSALVVESAIEEAIEEAVTLAAESGGSVVVVVEDEVIAVASPTDDDDAYGESDAAPGVFGENLTAYPVDADAPENRMFNVQKSNPVDRTDTTARMEDLGDEVDASAATATATAGLVGSMATASPLMQGVPMDIDEGATPARPLLDEDANPPATRRVPGDDDTALVLPEDEPEPPAELDTEEPSPLLGEEMLDLVEEDSAETGDTTDTTDAPDLSEEMLTVSEPGETTAVFGAPADEEGARDVPGGSAPEYTIDAPAQRQAVGGEDESADETMVAVTPGSVVRTPPGDTADEAEVRTTPGPSESDDALTPEELDDARENTDSEEVDSGQRAVRSGEAASLAAFDSRLVSGAAPTMERETPAPSPTPAPEREPASEEPLTPEELEEARVDTDEGQVSPEPIAQVGSEDAELFPDPSAALLPPEEMQGDEDAERGTAPPLPTANVRHDVPLMTADDLYLFNEGTHTRLYDKLGSHPRTVGGVDGTHFAVWAPNARAVQVIGPFNEWAGAGYDLAPNGGSGIWEGFLPGIAPGTVYKYHVVSNYNHYEVDKADPFAVYAEPSPRTASVVWDTGYTWGDDEWMRERGARNAANAPISIYEVHIGSWRRVPEDGNRPLTYGEMAEPLADYVLDCGFTHVEFMPVMEHPFYGSWGYQVTGFFAPTSRYGTPQDFAYLVDYLHQRGIGVILDWVPSHFPTDQHGLDYFDGTHLYEHADPRQGFHPDWKSNVFNYGRDEVRSFLKSSATFWCDRFHADGLRVDGVASMLYLDYSRSTGEWVPNRYGGRENLDAVSLLKELNTSLYEAYPDMQTTAEESTSWPMVSRPTYLGGLGFGMKWDMGWMHDTLEYMEQDPIYRQFNHKALTFRLLYSFFENFILPLSHDEVVYLKGSLIRKMSGADDWQKFANLRLLYGYQWAQSGKKLLFMGGEFAQWGEWNHDSSLDWHLLDHPAHAGVRTWLRDLNRAYRDIPALHARDFDPQGFAWIDANDTAQSVASFLRFGDDRDDPVLVAANFTPVPRHGYRLGVPFAGRWDEVLNSDGEAYGGSGAGNLGGVTTDGIGAHGHAQSLAVTVPPLGVVYFRRAYGG